nr:MAG TPA: hypothetical protein [Caudoviricetes sp.]
MKIGKKENWRNLYKVVALISSILDFRGVEFR